MRMSLQIALYSEITESEDKKFTGIGVQPVQMQNLYPLGNIKIQINSSNILHGDQELIY